MVSARRRGGGGDGGPAMGWEWKTHVGKDSTLRDDDASEEAVQLVVVLQIKRRRRARQPMMRRPRSETDSRGSRATRRRVRDEGQHATP